MFAKSSSPCPLPSLPLPCPLLLLRKQAPLPRHSPPCWPPINTSDRTARRLTSDRMGVNYTSGRLPWPPLRPGGISHSDAGLIGIIHRDITTFLVWPDTSAKVKRDRAAGHCGFLSIVHIVPECGMNSPVELIAVHSELAPAISQMPRVKQGSNNRSSILRAAQME